LVTGMSGTGEEESVRYQSRGTIMQEPVLDSDYWDSFYREKNDWGKPWPQVLVVAKELQYTFGTPTIRVLDLACGNGRYTIPLAQIGACVDCIDFSEVAIAQVRTQAKELGISDLIKTHWIDVREFLIKPCWYHLVLASGLFEYLRESELHVLIRDVQTGTVAQGINIFVYLLQHPQATRIIGEYPLVPGIVESIYESSHAWQIVFSEVSLKEDCHPLEKRGKPQKHKHCVARMVARKVR